MNEAEPRRLRPGESVRRPWGGNVADKPFAKALHRLAVAGGFETQSSLGRALGVDQTVISKWYRGESAPSPESFGRILELLQPGGEEHDTLVDAYGGLLEEGYGQRPILSTEKALERGRKQRKEARTDFDRWVFEFCDRGHARLEDFFAPIGLAGKPRGQFGLETYSAILEHAPQAHNLGQQEINSLGEAIVATIQGELENGHVFKGSSNTSRVQQNLPCTTYNGAQAARELGVSRARVQQLRKKYGLSMLLIDKDLDMFKAKARASSKTKIGITASEKM